MNSSLDRDPPTPGGSRDRGPTSPQQSQQPEGRVSASDEQHGALATGLRHWRAHVDGDGICWVTLDRAGSSTNVLSSEVLREADTLLARLENAPPRAVVIASAKRGFVAGADITEFDRLHDPEQAYDLIRRGQLAISRIAELPCPTVAALNGFALGGGLELALACRYRVMVDDPAVILGLPEVKLGLHPGFGGTVRTIRLIGPVPAMNMMLTGRNVRAREARRLGLVDDIVPARHLTRAARAIALRAPPRRRRPLVQTLLDSPLIRNLVAARMRRRVAREARREHYPAPYATIDLWLRYADASEGTFLQAEARSIAALICTPTSRNLVRVFALQDRLKGLAPRAAPRPQHIHVIGAGVMGGDIAAWCAMQGLRVTLQDRDARLLAPAVARAQRLFRRRLKEPRAVTAAWDRLVPDAAGDGAAQADMVIEAIVEDLDAKRALFRELEGRVRTDAVLATNTSSLRLEQIAAALERPERLIGVHFFNPVARLPLVEVVSGAGTDEAMRDRGLALVKAIGKLPLPCASAPGFVVNRVLMPYLMEAFLAVEEGVDPVLVDAAATRFGMPVGPVELADTIGLDVCRLVAGVFERECGLAVPARLDAMVEAGQLGRKSERGFYHWRDGRPLKQPVKAGLPPSRLTDRLILPMLNACAALLREGVVADADLLDAAVIFGAGFAPFTGGPMKYALHQRGIDEVVASLQELRARHGDRFAPDEPGWQTLCAARHEHDGGGEPGA